jgi:hypothetical protein
MRMCYRVETPLCHPSGLSHCALPPARPAQYSMMGRWASVERRRPPPPLPCRATKIRRSVWDLSASNWLAARTSHVVLTPPRG